MDKSQVSPHSGMGNIIPVLPHQGMGLGNSTPGFLPHPGMDSSKPCVLSQAWATASSQAREKVSQSTHSGTATVSEEFHLRFMKSKHPKIATVSQKSHLVASQYIQE
jgi:hypothetical protein